jgi:putative hydrolase of the HAD superfamily
MRKESTQTRPGRYVAVSFDCYGTLVDWKAGLSLAVAAELPRANEESTRHLLEQRSETEWEILEGLTEFEPYREVLAKSLALAAQRIGLSLPAEACRRIAAGIGLWPPYPDAARALSRLDAGGFRVAVASNVDREDLAATLERLECPGAHCVSAEDVQSYKPEPDHLMALVHELGIDEHELLHVSAYPEYDLLAAQDLGIPCALVDRLDRPVPEDLELALRVRDLDELCDRLLRPTRRRR